MKQILLILVLALQTANLYAYATCTNIIDIAALAACGTGTTNGWDIGGIDSYKDGKINIKLNAKADYLVSPDFTNEVLSVAMRVKSSSTSGRKLAILPYIDNEYVANEAMRCDYSTNSENYTPQIVYIPENIPTSRFKIALTDPNDSSTTAWGISYLAVITATEPRFASPKNVFASHIHASTAKITWDYNPSVASNIVTVSTITKTPESFTILINYDFSLCKQVKHNDNEDKSEAFSKLYSDFTANLINYSTFEDGVIKVSTASKDGRLSHKGFHNYQAMSIEITAKRYPGDNNISHVSAYYIDDQLCTNEIGSISIADEYTTGHIPLSATPGGVTINIGSINRTEPKRRFFIDRIAFLQDYTPAYLTTNLLYTTVVPKGTPCRLTGLTRSSEYLVTVTAIDENGQHAKPSAPIIFSTAEKDTGTMIWCR